VRGKWPRHSWTENATLPPSRPCRARRRRTFRSISHRSNGSNNRVESNRVTTRFAERRSRRASVVDAVANAFGRKSLTHRLASRKASYQGVRVKGTIWAISWAVNRFLSDSRRWSVLSRKFGQSVAPWRPASRTMATINKRQSQSRPGCTRINRSMSSPAAALFIARAPVTPTSRTNGRRAILAP